MTIDEVLERSTILLPMPLSLERTEKLLVYIAEQLPANISYKLSSHHSIYPEEEKASKQLGTVSITGSIKSLKDVLASDSFNCTHSEKDRNTSRISLIKFSIIPGYELDEYRKEVTRLWDDVRKLVSEYFKI